MNHASDFGYSIAGQLPDGQGTEYRIECRDGPDSHWYILGSSRTLGDAKYQADRYRRMLYANGSEIRIATREEG